MAQTLPRNAEVADQLDLLADISEILAEESFKVIAYRRAATRIRETPSPVAELALAGRATELPGIGKTIEQKVVEIVNDGEMHALTRRRERVPVGVVDFLRLPGVGPKTAARIWTELGVTTLESLKTAAEDGRLRDLSGLGQKSEEKILNALEAGVGEQAEPRRLLGAGLPAVRRVVEELEAHPAAIAVSEAGSARRRRETVRDLDLIATSSDAPALIAAFCQGNWVRDVAARGPTKATVVGHDELRFDLRVVPPECYGNVLQHFSGSKDHNVALREEAQRRGLSISEYGVTVVETGEIVTHATEEELYAYLGYAFIPPELRENDGELGGRPRGRATQARRALRPPRRDALPLDLVLRRQELDRGDGDRVEESRVQVPLPDRSLALPARCADGGAVAGDRSRQRARQTVPDPARSRGQHPSRRLARCRRTRCSRSSTGSSRRCIPRSSAAPTERILGALDNPHVDCIGHLTGRRILKRAGADVDIERVVVRAAETGTALEINSQPDRLDLRDTHARLAGEAGVRIPVTTDAHSTTALGYAEFGIGLARRAWLTKEQVLNTRTWAQIEKLKR